MSPASKPAAASDKVDVLIVGAGPAGLMCALGLVKAGVSVRIVDQSPTRVLTGHADGIMPRTIEVLQSYGLADELLRLGCQCRATSNYNYDADAGAIKRTTRTAMFNEPSARYKFGVLLHQGSIEGIFVDALNADGVAVDRPVKPTALEISADEKELSDPEAYPIKVTVKHLAAAPGEASEETIQAKFVVGADGAHSWVRRTLGIRMEGEQTAYAWGAIDFIPSPDSNFPDWRNITTINGKDAGIMLIPREDGKIRLYIELGAEEGLVDPETGRLDLSQFSAQRLLDIAKETFLPYKLTTPIESVDWWTVYIIGQRVASNFSVHDRVFIAGDACHTHSPKGGQGMNASMSDGHNLSWKLAYVIRGWSPMSLLKTYEIERRRFAQELIAFDKWYAELFSTKSKSKSVSEDPDMVFTSPLEAFQKFSALTTGVGIHYMPSTITSATFPAASGLTVGKRITPQPIVHAADLLPVDIQDICPADARMKVLVFPGDLRSAEDVQALGVLAAKLDSALSNYPKTIFDVSSIFKSIGDEFCYMDVPQSLRSDWKSVLMDSPTAVSGIYDAYGIAEGAFVVVRPDGYVGTTLPLGDVGQLTAYFSHFLK